MEKVKIGMEALATLTLKSESSDERARYRIYHDADSGLSIHVRKANNAPKNGEFLPGLVKDGEGKTLWAFAQENFSGLGRIVVVKGEPIIALVTRTTLCKVIPVRDIPKTKEVVVGNTVKIVGGQGVQQMVMLKHYVAEALGCQAKVSEQEKTLLAKIRHAEETRLAREKAKKEEERRKRVAEILDRPSISGYPESGKCRFGTPVLEDEWQMLDVGTGVILVSEFSDSGDPVGNEAIAFFTGRDKGGRPEKKAEIKISLRRVKEEEKPKQKEQGERIEISSCEEILFEVEEDRKEIGAGFYEAILTDSHGLSILKKAGLNSGTLVAIPDSSGSQEDRVQVIKMSDDGAKTLGIFPVL